MTNETDLAALHRLVNTYARSVDVRDENTFSSLFAPHAVIEGPGGRIATPEAIRNTPASLRIFTKTLHTIFNTIFNVNGDRASGTVYCAAHHLTPIAEGGYNDLVMYLVYNDDYVRSEGCWVFDRRRVDIEFTENRPVENLGAMPTMNLRFE